MSPHLTARLSTAFLSLTLGASLCWAAPDPPAPPKATSDLKRTVDVQTAIRETIAEAQTEGKAITFSFQKGECRLSGEAPDLATKLRVERWVAALQDVEDVESELTVRAHADKDARRASDFLGALAADELTRSLKIQAEVSGSELELSGAVTFAQREWILELARQVPGIASIDDELNVTTPEAKPEEPPSDALILRRVRSMLQGERRHDYLGVLVRVKEGVVNLSGTLRSVKAIDPMRTLASVPGVRGIESEDVRVAWNKTGSPAAPTPAQPRPEDLQALLETRLTLHPRLATPLVQLTHKIEGGEVTLGGKAATLHEQELAVELAQNTRGVTKVHNRIVIETGSPAPSADAIHEQVMAGVQGRIVLVRAGAALRVERARVIFTTAMTDARERAHARDVASRVRGVTEVVFAEPLPAGAAGTK